MEEGAGGCMIAGVLNAHAMRKSGGMASRHMAWLAHMACG